MKSDIKYIHLRYHDVDGKLQSKGGATIAFVLNENVLTFAISECCPTDNFKKNIARARAGGRLKSKTAVQINMKEKLSLKDIISMLVEEYYCYKEHFLYDVRALLY
jgi:hypothetical protein